MAQNRLETVNVAREPEQEEPALTDREWEVVHRVQNLVTDNQKNETTPQGELDSSSQEVRQQMDNNQQDAFVRAWQYLLNPTRTQTDQRGDHE